MNKEMSVKMDTDNYASSVTTVTLVMHGFGCKGFREKTTWKWLA